MRSTVAIPTVISAILVLCPGGCESVPGSSGPGPVRVVELLDPYFVRFEKERIPIDEFLFRMRQLGRDADKTDTFSIRILAPENMALEERQALDRIMSELQVSGIRHVKMG